MITFDNDNDLIRYAQDKYIQEYLQPSTDNNKIRLDAHMFTDKVIYRPNDVMFIEVLVVDAFDKTPIGLNPYE
jgi:uncharacterized protein YfaS (alpha-2-macroglobulin family)